MIRKSKTVVVDTGGGYTVNVRTHKVSNSSKHPFAKDKVNGKFIRNHTEKRPRHIGGARSTRSTDRKLVKRAKIRYHRPVKRGGQFYSKSTDSKVRVKRKWTPNVRTSTIVGDTFAIGGDMGSYLSHSLLGGLGFFLALYLFVLLMRSYYGWSFMGMRTFINAFCYKPQTAGMDTEVMTALSVIQSGGISLFANLCQYLDNMDWGIMNGLRAFFSMLCSVCGTLLSPFIIIGQCVGQVIQLISGFNQVTSPAILETERASEQLFNALAGIG